MTWYRVIYLWLILFLAARILFGNNNDPLNKNGTGQLLSEAFLVNDDVQSGCQQGYAVIAGDSSGNYVIAWADQRNGSCGNWGGNYYYRGWDIYMQRYDSNGNPLGPNQKVNDNTGYLTPNSGHPLSIAMNKRGHLVIVWEDVRQDAEVIQDLYYQVYDVQGNPIGVNRKANEGNTSDRQESAAVAMDEEGNFIIVWQNTTEDWGDFKILFRKFNADGNPAGPGQMVDVDDGSSWTHLGGPTIAIDKTGRFAISWIGQTNGGWTPDILLQRYNAEANPLGPIQTVNDDTTHFEHASPVLAMNEQGDFIVTWEDARNSYGADVDYYDIYMQRFDSNGAAIGSNILVNDDGIDAGQFHPWCALNSDGKIIISWQDNRAGRSFDAIYFQQYDSNGIALGGNKKVDPVETTFSQSSPGLFMDKTGGFVLVWQDDRNGILNRDIYLQHFNADGNTQNVSQIANDDTGSSDQTQPVVAMDGKGGYIVVWTDERNSFVSPNKSVDIYFQQYNAAGNPVGPNRKVNDLSSRISDPFTPAVAADAEGNFVIAWTDSRTHSWDIYCQRYDATGNAIGNNIMVNDDGDFHADQRSPVIAMNSNGDCVIAWTYYYGWDSSIQYQVFDADGHRVGANRTSDYSTGGDLPAIAMDGSGRFTLAWYIDAYYNIEGVETIVSDVYVQCFDNEGNSLGNARKVNNVAEGKRGGPALAMNSGGVLVVAWQDAREGTKDVYYQRYNNTGNPVGTNLKANDDTGIAAPYSPAVVINSAGEFVVVWADERLVPGSAVMVAQAINADGSWKGNNFYIDNSTCMRFPAVAANSNKILFTWQDNLRAKGFDIYGKLMVWDATTAVAETKSFPAGHALLQNYPNPFNPETVIPYRLNEPGQVTISIVNVVGQQVCELVSAKQEAGNYQVFWKGNDQRGVKVNSGVYFCRMSVENNVSVYQTTKKICLLR